MTCSDRGMRAAVSLLLAAMLGACTAETSITVPNVAADPCPAVDLADALAVSDCLLMRGVISQADRDTSVKLFGSAERKVDSIQALGGAVNFEKGARIARSLALVANFHSRGLFADSARFHRLMDVVSVGIQISEDKVSVVGGKVRPPVTPYLLWYSYDGIGAYFQPVTTAQTVAHLLPRATAPTDSLINMAENLYSYALWRQHGDVRFPVWEYQFTWTSGGITAESPWVSSMAQGLVMAVFAESYRRTGLPIWKSRAYEVLNSFKVTWSNGGVMLDDTSSGYWWEEFHPVVRVWNGSVQALVDVGFLWSVTQDPVVKQMFDRGIEKLKYHTPEYDTGSWTLYSRTQGLNSVAYHSFQIESLDVLYAQSGDPWFQVTADRWRSYVPPPGVY